MTHFKSIKTYVLGIGFLVLLHFQSCDNAKYVNRSIPADFSATITANETNDTDDDGLTDEEETEWETETDIPDTDGDGLVDGDEVDLGTDPLNPDTDGDGLPDGSEVDGYGTDPLNPDSDDDGISDGDEVDNGTDPLEKNTAPAPTAPTTTTPTTTTSTAPTTPGFTFPGFGVPSTPAAPPASQPILARGTGCDSCKDLRVCFTGLSTGCGIPGAHSVNYCADNGGRVKPSVLHSVYGRAKPPITSKWSISGWGLWSPTPHFSRVFPGTESTYHAGGVCSVTYQDNFFTPAVTENWSWETQYRMGGQKGNVEYP